MSDKLLSVTVDDGKYTVEQDASGRLTALRYSQPWRDCCGDGLILSLAYEVDFIRDQLKALTAERDKLREALQELRDWQNGPPLLGEKWETGWGHAIKLADAALDTKDQP